MSIPNGLYPYLSNSRSWEGSWLCGNSQPSSAIVYVCGTEWKSLLGLNAIIALIFIPSIKRLSTYVAFWTRTADLAHSAGYFWHNRNTLTQGIDIRSTEGTRLHTTIALRPSDNFYPVARIYTAVELGWKFPHLHERFHKSDGVWIHFELIDCQMYRWMFKMTFVGRKMYGSHGVSFESPRETTVRPTWMQSIWGRQTCKQRQSANDNKCKAGNSVKIRLKNMTIRFWALGYRCVSEIKLLWRNMRPRNDEKLSRNDVS